MAIEVVNKRKIGAIVAASFVAGILGTLSINGLQTNVDSPTSYSQSVDVGANVLVEIIHEDGTKDVWEGHNNLEPYAKNFLVACITGLDTTPFGTNDCTFDADNVRILTYANYDPPQYSDPVQGTITPQPGGCDFDDENNLCTGWNITAIFDFVNLECEPGPDCPALVGVASGGDTFETLFNRFSVNPEKPILPNDRVLVSMDIDIPT